jgi:hypothetical protein
VADPITLKLSDQELFDRIRRHHPHLSADDILAIAAAFGFDLNVDTDTPPEAPQRA